jgi:signal transduction histidine kinase
VAREFAERLHGALTLRSEAGVGTTFLLRIPLRAPRRIRRRPARV